MQAGLRGGPQCCMSKTRTKEWAVRGAYAVICWTKLPPERVRAAEVLQPGNVARQMIRHGQNELEVAGSQPARPTPCERGLPGWIRGGHETIKQTPRSEDQKCDQPAPSPRNEV